MATRALNGLGLALCLLCCSPALAVPIEDHTDMGKLIDLILQQQGKLHSTRVTVHTNGGNTVSGEIKRRTKLLLELKEDKGTKTMKGGKQIWLLHYVQLAAINGITIEAYDAP